MTRVSLFDQFFYRSEQAGSSPLYIGGAMIIDARKSPYKLNAAVLVEHVAARLERIPLIPMRKRPTPTRTARARNKRS